MDELSSVTVSAIPAEEDFADAPALGGDRALRVQVVTLAGDGIAGYVDDVGAAARFNYPYNVACDEAGNVFVADTSNHRIRRIAPDGTVTTLAGDGLAGHIDGAGATARFNYPRGVAVDGAGNVYVGDTDNDRIRKITPQRVVSTFSGEGVRGFADGARAAARFYHPNGLAVDQAGNVYVADASNRKVRKVSPGGTASTLAGDAISGYADGLGTEARFNSPRAVAVDAAGTVFVADYGNSRIRKVSREGRVTAFAGDGRGCHLDGVGTAASFNDPTGVAVDAAGNVFVADSESHCIRQITPDGVVTTIAGDGKGLADFADGSGALARFNTPRGLWVAANGIIYVADTLNHCIRKITLG